MRSPSRDAQSIGVVAVAIASVPVVVALVALASRDAVPLPDTAIIATRVRDVFTGDSPLTGVYSRYGWNHPGPLLFYALAPLTELFGGASSATLAGAAVLQVIALLLAAWVAWRRGGVMLVLLVVTTVALTARAVGPGIYLDPWNPFPPVTLLVGFVLLVWSTALGDRWLLVGAALVGSFLVQAHVGYVPLVGAGALYLTGIAVIAITRQPTDVRGLWRAWRAPIGVALLVAVVAWIPPLVDEIVHAPGNLSAIASDVDRSGRDTAGLDSAVAVMADEFRPWPRWVGAAGDGVLGRDPGVVDLAWIVVPGALVALATWIAARRGDRGALALVGLVAVMVVGGTFGMARYEPPLFDWLTLWTIPLALLVVLAMVRALIGCAPPRAPLNVIGACAALVTITISAGAVSVRIAEEPERNPVAEQVRALTTRVMADPPAEPVLVRNAGTRFAGFLLGWSFDPLIDRLDRRGVPVRVDRSLARQYGGHRVAAPRDVREVWYVSDAAETTTRLVELPGAHLVARWRGAVGEGRKDAAIVAVPSDQAPTRAELRSLVLTLG